MNTKTSLRPTYLEVDLDRIKYNIKNIKSYIGDSKLMAILKANAYGAGSVEVARIGAEYIDYIGVATLIEALELRKNKIETDILILGFIEENHIDKLVENNITQTIYNLDQALKINEEAKKQNKNARVHIKIDTGMSRLGLQVKPESIKTIVSIKELENIDIEGIFTHLMDAENSDKILCEIQYERFINFIEKLEEEDINIPIKHILNSGGILSFIDYKMDLVRSGILIHGLYPDQVDASKIKTKFTSSLKTKVADIKYIEDGDYVGYARGFRASAKMKIAVLPIGYSDGYTEEIRKLINPKVNGVEAPVIGNICMDQTVINISGLEQVKIGDIVTLIDCDETTNVDIKWIASIARRVPRVYKIGGEVKYIRDYLLD